MKRIMLLGLLLFTVMAGDAIAAACNGASRLNAGQILTLLQNKLICATAPTGKRWAEEHNLTAANGGELWEHARGSNNKVDPRRRAGRWSIGTDPNGTIIYNYLGNPPGNPYEWSVWQAISGAVNFCSTDGTTLIAAAKLHDLNTVPPTAVDPCGFTP